DERRRRGGVVRAVQAHEVDGLLASGAGCDRAVGGAGRNLGPRLRGVEHDVDVLMRRVALIGGRTHLGVVTEEGVARRAVARGVATVARRRASLLRVAVEARIVDGDRRDWRLRGSDVLSVVGLELKERTGWSERGAAVG